MHIGIVLPKQVAEQCAPAGRLLVWGEVFGALPGDGFAAEFEPTPASDVTAALSSFVSWRST